MIARAHSKAVELLWQCNTACFSGGYGRAEQHLLPQIGIKAWCRKKCGMVNHRWGNLVVLAEEAKVLRAVGAT